MTILLVTNRRDITSDFVVRELQNRNLPFHRFNTETVSSCRIAHDPTAGEMTFAWEDATLKTSGVKAAYFRRPEAPTVTGEKSIREYRESEWNACLKALYLTIGDRWFTHPASILLAEDKIGQLRLAKSLGFNVPETLITNSVEAAAEFVSKGRSVGKVLRQALIDGDEECVVFTTRVHAITQDDASAVSACPFVLQREIPKRVDIRATVVGQHVFAVAIHSQETADTTVDWRRGSNPELRHEIVDLPDAIASLCVAYVKKQNLRFGAIDLVEDDCGQYWFLECNPNGQWAWIQNRTGLPIASAIVDELERLASC